MSGLLRRLPWAICCALFVCLVPCSASWAATVPQLGSASSWLSAGSYWASVDEPEPAPSAEPSGSPDAPDSSAEPEPVGPSVPPVTVTETATPEPAPTITVTAEPEPEPVSNDDSLAAEDGSAVVSLNNDQMSFFLLVGSLLVFMVAVLMVRAFRSSAS